MAANLNRGGQAGTTIRAVIAVAGVETEEQLRFLATGDCKVQVYCIGWSTPIEDYAEVVDRAPVRGPHEGTHSLG